MPDLSNPTRVSSGVGGAGGTFNYIADAFFPAIDDEGVKCWGLDDWSKTETPSLLETPTDVIVVASMRVPSQTSIQWESICPQRGVKCWGGINRRKYPRAHKPGSVSSGALHTCALSDEGIKCWGYDADDRHGITLVPELVIDPDGDTFSNQNGQDAFPLDPAASRDTDGDGKPDDWNTGKTEKDSTMSLRLDNDDDNDGVLDTVDAFRWTQLNLLTATQMVMK